ncbi:uncharacterized protein RCO7_03925 [Rhynchosporium graminicola]|uniref:3'-5' exonuclease domain-containing protein n=1 Tax=Rhynchosporium graminicola TaxID=2792576 RepID=A0A1E1L5I0_9HELO|nr:uncharacterized protein RCO7_03925 [Rhynchosporium commune]
MVPPTFVPNQNILTQPNSFVNWQMDTAISFCSLNQHTQFPPQASWAPFQDKTPHFGSPASNFRFIDPNIAYSNAVGRAISRADPVSVKGSYQPLLLQSDGNSHGFVKISDYWPTGQYQHIRSYSGYESAVSMLDPQDFAFQMIARLPRATYQLPVPCLPSMGWKIPPYIDRGVDMVLAPLRSVKTGIAEIFMDEESGPHHGRNGRLSTIQISFASASGLTYVLDVITLGATLFAHVAPNGKSLKSIFEDPNIIKVFFDVRADVAALDGQFQIKLAGGIDLQIMELGTRGSESKTHLLGLNTCVKNHLRLCTKEKAIWSSANAGGGIFLAGDYTKWEVRPLPEPLLEYAANDTVYMGHLYSFYLSILKGDPAMMEVVLVESTRRIAESQVEGFEGTKGVSPDVFVMMD